MADYWMKLYIEILDDPKMATLPDRVWRRVIELFLVAKRLGKEGHLPDTRQIAWMLRMSPDELDADMAQIVHTGIIEREVNGWFIPKFSQRQAAVPVAERKAQQRRREKSQQYYGDVTKPSRGVTQSTEDRLTEDREQRTEEDGAPASPDSDYKNVNGLSPQSKAERIYRLVTGQTTFPGTSAGQCIDAITAISSKFPAEDDIVNYLRLWWGWWIAQRTKHGRPYSKTNTAWLIDNAISGDPPETQEDTTYREGGVWRTSVDGEKVWFPD